jgi:hypothetical protein
VSEQIDNRIKDANKKAVERIQSLGPVLVDVKPAIFHVKKQESKTIRNERKNYLP